MALQENTKKLDSSLSASVFLWYDGHSLDAHKPNIKAYIKDEWTASHKVQKVNGTYVSKLGR